MTRGAVINADGAAARTGKVLPRSKKLLAGAIAAALPLTALAGIGRPARISSPCALAEMRGSATASPCRAVLMLGPPKFAVADAVASTWNRLSSDSSSNAIRPEQVALIGVMTGFARLNAMGKAKIS